MYNHYKKLYEAKLTTAQNAVQCIASGQALGIGMAIGQPPALLNAVTERINNNLLQNLTVYYKLAFTHLEQSLLQPKILEKINANSFFITVVDQKLITLGKEMGKKLLSYVPANFSHLPKLFENTIKLNTFIITASPMDKGGYFSLGTNNDYATTAIKQADHVILEINSHMPRVFGQSQVHISEVTAVVENHQPLIQIEDRTPNDTDLKIGAHVAQLVPDRATIQLGIGNIPSAVATCLSQHKDLGIHTELLSTCMSDLIKKGVVTGKYKTLHPGKVVFTVAMGNNDLYEFMNDNSCFESYPSSYVNNSAIIAQHDNFISINTALEVDLYGQVNAEFLNHHQYSGSGGQLDFVRGSYYSKHGKSIIALQSTTRQNSVSKIVPQLDNLITDPRVDVEYIVTEFGVANLRGKSTKERALALIAIAHPDFRESLAKAAKEINLL